MGGRTPISLSGLKVRRTIPKVSVGVWLVIPNDLMLIEDVAGYEMWSRRSVHWRNPDSKDKDIVERWGKRIGEPMDMPVDDGGMSP